ncbi:nephrin-like isoform X2 [Panulirus ornatus]|uniref:nephrin-like isoform X2 n=1 Tax=Panulirus ornatus TaxID=150431 RepID=UPI003A89F7EB
MAFTPAAQPVKPTFCFALMMSIICVLTGVEEQLFRVTPVSVQVKTGEDVFLRCVVDNQQGNVQWTKDGFALGFEREVPGYPRYHYLGDGSKGEHHLVIKGVTLQDDGEYQCQVGPTSASEAMWAAANVTVMVSPVSISVSGVGEGTGTGELIQRVNGAVVEARAGRHLTLECVVRDARPAPSVVWYRNGVTLLHDLHSEEVEVSQHPRRWSVRSRLVVRVEAEDHGQQYSCRALHPALKDSPTSLVASVTLAVLHAPNTPVISGYVTGEALSEGERRLLMCRVMGGNPRPWVTWYRHGRPLNPTSMMKDTVGVSLSIPAASLSIPAASLSIPAASLSIPAAFLSIPTADAHGNNVKEEGVSVAQLVTATREEDGAVYECRVTSQLLERPLITNVTLTVHYPPRRVTVTGPTLAAVGQRLTLTCVTSPANPPASITWMVQGVEVRGGSSSVNQEESGGWVTTSELVHHLLGSHTTTQVTVECRSHHPVADRILTRSWTLDIVRRPASPVVQVEGGDGPEFAAGTRLRFLCTSEGGRPPPAVTMYKNKEELATEIEQDGNVTKARAEVQVVPADNGAEVRCQVTSPATPTPMTARTTIHLRFPASELRVWVKPSKVEAGEEAAIMCESSSSRPAASISWYSQGATLQGATTSHSPGQFGGTVTRSELLVRTATADNGRDFTCNAHNGLGVTLTNNVTLNVLYGPVWLEEPASIVDVEEGEDLVITVAAVANPPPIRYTWWRGPLPVDGVDAEDDGNGQLRMTTVHRQDAGIYSVTAASPRGVLNASFTINVLYGPEGVVATERVIVDEGGSANVSCSAVGNPTPNITWTRDPLNNTSWSDAWWGVGEARLVVEQATRLDTALYYCHASNSVSSAPPVTTALVVTQSPTPPVYSEEEMVGRWWAAEGSGARLDCRVVAAPAPTFRWTINDDRVLLNSHKYFVRLPQLVDGLLEWSSVLEIRKVSAKDYIQYACTAFNSLGSLTTNYTLGPPVPPTVPTHLHVSTVTANTVSLSWTNNDSEVLGFTVRYQAAGSSDYEFVDVRGINASSVIIEGLTSGAEYYFTIQAYSEQGRSHYTSPAVVITMLNMENGVANSSSSSNNNLDQPRIPRLILLLMCLTGAALLVLNISIIVCFVRRHAIKRSASGSSNKTTAVDVFTPPTTPGSAGHDDLKRGRPVDIVAATDNQDIVSVKKEVNPEELGIVSQQVITASARLHASSPLMSHQDTTEKTHQLIKSPTGSHKAVAFMTPPLGVQPVMKETHQLRTTSPLIEHKITRETPHIQVTPPYPSHQVIVSLPHTTLPIACGSPRLSNNSSSHDGEIDMHKENTLTQYDDLSEGNVSESSSDSPIHGKNVASQRVSSVASNIPDVCLKSSRPYEPLIRRHQNESLQQHAEADKVSVSSQLSIDSCVDIHGQTRRGSSPSHPHSKLGSPHPATPHYDTKSRGQRQSQTSPLCLPSKPASQVIYHGQPHIQQQLEDQQLHQQLQEVKPHQHYSAQKPSHQLGHYHLQHQEHTHGPFIEECELQCNRNEHHQDLHRPPHMHGYQKIHERQQRQPLQQQQQQHHHHQQSPEGQQEQQPYQQHQHYHQRSHNPTDNQHYQHRQQLPMQQRYQQEHKLEEQQQLHYFEDHPHHKQLHYPGEHQQLPGIEDSEHRHHLHHTESHQHHPHQHEKNTAHFLPMNEKQHPKDLGLDCCKLESRLCYQEPHHHPHYMQEHSHYDPSARKPLQYETSTCELPHYDPSTCKPVHYEPLPCRHPQYDPSNCNPPQYEPSACEQPQCNPSHLTKYYAYSPKCCHERCRETRLGEVT